MIKDIIEKNENVTANDKEMAVLKENFPSCFDKDGKFDIVKFQEIIKDKVDITKEGYELNFLGKSYAKLLASIDTTTVIKPDVEHNSKPENEKSENIYISGDNLDALKHLAKSYAGLVKCIYIDPPYNTGSDGFVYNDKFEFTANDLVQKLSISEEEATRILDLTERGSASHSAWLTFMYPRLLLARDMLKDDGVIFISIDDNEQSNCKLLCDYVFGEDNFLTCISRATGTPTGGGFDGLVNELDYILVYSKNISRAIIYGLEMDEKSSSIYTEIDEQGNRYLSRSLRRTGGEDRREDRPTMYYPLIAPDGSEVFPIGPTGYESRWICAPAKAAYLSENNLIEWKKTTINGNKSWLPYQKYYLENRTKKPGNIWQDFLIDEDIENVFLWDDIEGNKKATREIRELFSGKKVFETAKPVDLLKRIIGIACQNQDLILDFFGGSSTTAHAIIDTNAKIKKQYRYILIQLAEKVKQGSDAEKAGFSTIDEIGQKRIELAAAKIKAENPGADIDYGFKHFTLVEPSTTTIDKIESFEQNGIVTDNDLLKEFGKETVLATWLNDDGYGLTTAPQEIDLAGYKAYFIGKHLYLLDNDFNNEAQKALFEKYSNEPEFNPENIVLFGYSFSKWTILESLKTNLRQLQNKKINFDIRY